MISVDERKVLLRAVRVEAIILVSTISEDVIRKTNQSDIMMRDLVFQMWENAHRRLRREGNAELLEREKLGDFDF